MSKHLQRALNLVEEVPDRGRFTPAGREEATPVLLTRLVPSVTGSIWAGRPSGMWVCRSHPLAGKQFTLSGKKLPSQNSCEINVL